MRKFKNYSKAEQFLIDQIVAVPDFVTSTTNESLGLGFILENPSDNMNEHSNYEYAKEFFQWMLSGDTELSSGIKELNPWAERFVSTTNLPENFSASYGFKIKQQLPEVINELHFSSDSRRAVINILIPEDQVILRANTTHEYPCTISLHFLIRNGKLILMVDMRSNNVYKVMPYDVYNFTCLQIHLAELLGCEVGNYYHYIHSAHIYKGDVRRLKEAKKK